MKLYYIKKMIYYVFVYALLNSTPIASTKPTVYCHCIYYTIYYCNRATDAKYCMQNHALSYFFLACNGISII